MKHFESCTKQYKQANLIIIMDVRSADPNDWTVKAREKKKTVNASLARNEWNCNFSFI